MHAKVLISSGRRPIRLTTTRPRAMPATAMVVISALAPYVLSTPKADSICGWKERTAKAGAT
jgi:hypothetical protein